ncbi:MAG: TPM domain-containing protein, partial [Planctomyces sp.]
MESVARRREHVDRGVSKEDRAARIQPGAGWGTADNLRFQQIMDEHMVPQFKQGQFAQGIVGGVIALDKMARGLKVPARTRSTAVRPGTMVLQGRGKSLRKLHRRAPPANDR